jgi:5'-AMP-activated protein kinase catalytic alpha subunit
MCCCFDLVACCTLQVRCHPWFTEHLPRYLAVMQADTAVTSPRLDEEMIHEVRHM